MVNLIISFTINQSLLPLKVIYSQLLGTRMCTSLGEIGLFSLPVSVYKKMTGEISNTVLETVFSR